MSILDRSISPRFDRSRYASALSYVDETDTGVSRKEVEFTIAANPVGGGTILVYDLQRPNTSNHLVSSNNQRINGWSRTENTGPANTDQIVFDAAEVPPVGTVVLVVYDFETSPRGEFFGRREFIDVDEESENSTFITTGDETLWQIAGRSDVYNDPSWWWVIADANPGLNGIFEAMTSPLPRDIELMIPAESEVLIQLEGLYEL